MSPLPSRPWSCPAANTCVISSEAAACGALPEHLPAELLAKELCPRALAGAIVAEEARPITAQSRQGTRAGKGFRLGSLYLDSAMNTPDDAIADQHFDAALGHLDKVAAENGLVGVHATFLKLHLPVMRRARYRKSFHSLPGDQIGQLRDGLLDIFDATTDTDHLAHERVALHLLCLRQGTLALPATGRELSISPLNLNSLGPRSHEYYTVDERSGRKIPHRLRVKAGTDTKGLVIARLGQIAEEAVNDVAPNTVDNLRQAQRLATDWLYDEAAGHALAPRERRILDTMSRILQKKQVHYLRRNPP